MNQAFIKTNPIKKLALKLLLFLLLNVGLVLCLKSRLINGTGVPGFSRNVSKNRKKSGILRNKIECQIMPIWKLSNIIFRHGES